MVADIETDVDADVIGDGGTGQGARPDKEKNRGRATDEQTACLNVDGILSSAPPICTHI